MIDAHDRDLEHEKKARKIEVETLREQLSKCSDKKTQLILKEWMRGVAEGTEHEAQQLLAFFHAWDAAYGSPRRSGRDFREDAVKCGLSRAVDLHFTALNMKQRVIGTTSLDLLRWAIYGYWGCTRQEKQEDDFKKMIRIEAIHEYETGEKMSQASLARAVNIDRKKVRIKKKEDGYRESVDVVKSILGKSKL